MTEKEKLLTQGLLKELLHYDPDTGVFTWRYRENNSNNFNKMFAYKKAGCIFNKSSNKYERVYITIRINKKRFNYFAHRLAWLYMTGKFPSKQIDHIDQNPLNNKFNNLRDVNATENQRNKKINSNNTSGYNGIYFDKQKNKWRAIIGVDGKKINLGIFEDIQDAIKAREDANINYNFHENHGRQ